MGGGDVLAIVKGPKEAYQSLAEKGSLTAKDSSLTVLFQSLYAGCYIGFGALLATKISAMMPGATEDNPGFKTFIFAALFPVNLLLIILSGGILFTGTSAACPAGVYEGKVRIVDALRCLAISWVGNVLGSFVFALFTDWCGLLEGPTAVDAIVIMEKKVSKGFLTTFLKGIGCNWMVCMAVFLSGQAQDMVGKYVGIWFPISTFVMIGFEHIPANFYLLCIGLLAKGETDVGFTDVLLKNWIPVTLGNFFAGAFLVAGGYSVIFGRLGGKTSLAPDNYALMSARRSMGVEPPDWAKTTNADLEAQTSKQAPEPEMSVVPKPEPLPVPTSQPTPVENNTDVKKTEETEKMNPEAPPSEEVSKIAL